MLSHQSARLWIWENLNTNNKNVKQKLEKNKKTIEIKEVKFRPNTDTHDFDVKMRSVFKFLENGDKVKITMRFRGREMAHQNLGLELLKRVQGVVVEAEAGKIENHPKSEGRQMTMLIGPNTK